MSSPLSQPQWTRPGQAEGTSHSADPNVPGLANSQLRQRLVPLRLNQVLVFLPPLPDPLLNSQCVPTSPETLKRPAEDPNPSGVSAGTSAPLGFLLHSFLTTDCAFVPQA